MALIGSWLSWIGLRFSDPAQEHEFWREYVHRHHRLALAIMFAGSLAYYGFFLWDKIIDPTRWELTHGVRALVMAFIWACVGCLLIPRLSRYLEEIATVAVSSAALGLAWVYAILDDGYDYGAAGTVLIVMFAASLLPLRVSYFFAFGLITLVGFLTGQYWAGNYSPGMPFVNALVIGCSLIWGLLGMSWREITARQKFLLSDQLTQAHVRVEELLHSMLPAEIVERIQSGETTIADSYGEVGIVFADLVGFTQLSKTVAPSHLVEILNALFSRLDRAAESFRVERIKTIGDSYMAVSGLRKGVTDPDHAASAADFALEIQRIGAELAEEVGYPIKLRVGLHIGPIVAGVIGMKRPAFDCWGDTVNLASRLEAAAAPGSILISESAYWRLRGTHQVRVLDAIELRGIGATKVFVLEMRTPDSLARSSKRIPIQRNMIISPDAEM